MAEVALHGLEDQLFEDPVFPFADLGLILAQVGDVPDLAAIRPSFGGRARGNLPSPTVNQAIAARQSPLMGDRILAARSGSSILRVHAYGLFGVW